MPILSTTEKNYQPPFLFKYRHFNTMYSTLFRKINIKYQREKIGTPDDDFINLDWQKKGHSKLVILCQGLEGSSDSIYVKGMSKAFLAANFDIVAYNYRTCGGETNRRLRAYHAGATDDLHTVIEHIIKTNSYQEIALVGFSLGGNLVLKYIGENPAKVPAIIQATVAISAPVDLECCSYEIAKSHNFIYNQRFLKKLRVKIKDKTALLETNGYDVEKLLSAKDFLEFDNWFTAPVHGFESAIDYYRKNGAKQFLKNIKTPALLINAKDDPFLAKEAFPYEAAQKNSYFHLLTPKYGGHVGFVTFNSQNQYWSETQTVALITHQLKN